MTPEEIAQWAEDAGPLSQCDTCMFWKQNENSELGACRRYPPKADPVQMAFVRESGLNQHDGASDSNWMWSQPCTSSDDWCGEYKRGVDGNEL